MTPGGRLIQIEVSKRFSISRHPITQAQWRSVMGTEPWLRPRVDLGSSVSQADYDAILAKKLMFDDDCPAIFVSWDEARMFCEALSKSSGTSYHLPTEAQWELACRAGSTGMFPWGDDAENYEVASRHAWFRLPRSKLRSEPRLQRVGQLLPNAFGLFDMCGLVKEWVLDRYDATDSFDVPLNAYFPSMTDPLGMSGTHAMARGGGFDSPLQAIASSRQVLHTPGNRQYDLGFRIVTSAN